MKIKAHSKSEERNNLYNQLIERKTAGGRVQNCFKATKGPLEFSTVNKEHFPEQKRAESRSCSVPLLQ